VKDGKVRFSISNPYIESLSYIGVVTISDVGPAKIIMLSKARNDAEWNSSKLTFTKNLNGLMNDLEKELHTSTDF
jgi:hypothetical protein